MSKFAFLRKKLSRFELFWETFGKICTFWGKICIFEGGKYQICTFLGKNFPQSIYILPFAKNWISVVQFSKMPINMGFQRFVVLLMVVYL